jgi:hypothetical protein
MKNTLFFLLFSLSLACPAFAQEAFTTAIFQTGYGVTQFGEGLKEAYKAGNYGSSGGGLFYFGFYRKFSKVSNLQFGMIFKALAASPAKGDNGNELFFNTWNCGLSLRYYPFNKKADKGFYIHSEYLFVGQFTQKYRNQTTNFYDHQFAIGGGFNGGLAYEFRTGEKTPLVSIGAQFEATTRRGEVQGIGKKTFKNTNAGFLVGIRF